MFNCSLTLQQLRVVCCHHMTVLLKYELKTLLKKFDIIKVEICVNLWHFSFLIKQPLDEFRNFFPVTNFSNFAVFSSRPTDRFCFYDPATDWQILLLFPVRNRRILAVFSAIYRRVLQFFLTIDGRISGYFFVNNTISVRFFLRTANVFLFSPRNIKQYHDFFYAAIDWRISLYLPCNQMMKFKIIFPATDRSTKFTIFFPGTDRRI